MEAVRTNPYFRLLAALAPLLAVAPIVFGLSGGWIALHLAGGAISLVVLIIAALTTPPPWRWYAVTGVIVSVAAIAVVTDGGSIGTVVQVAMLIVLGAIYVACVFWPHGRDNA